MSNSGSAMHADLVIVGAGMVGLTLAALVAPSGLKIKVLESRDVDLKGISDWEGSARQQGYDPRVSALTIASQQALSVAGAWSRIQDKRVTPYTGMDVWDGEGTGNIQFQSRELHESCLGHIVENRVTVTALCEALAQLDNVELIAAAEVVDLSEPDDQQLRTIQLANGWKLSASLVVAADGALSDTRRLAGIGMWEWDYGHHAIVTTIKTEQPHQSTCWQRFTDDGPLALLPLDSDDGDHYCSIVWSTSPDHAGELMALDEVEFCEALGQAIEQRLGRISWTDRRFVFPLRQRHARQYVKPGFAAIGDAAHTIHPLAGQGVNLGLMDAAALAEVILDSVRDAEPWHSEYVLKRFQRARQSENLQMAATMEGFRRLFGTGQPLARLLRNAGMSLMNNLSPVKNHIVLQAMGLSGELPRLARRPIRS